MNEPLPAEYPYPRKQKMFTYFHLAGVTPTLIRQFLERRTTAIVYEIVENAAGKLLLLAPMSGVAGNMALSIGNHYLA